MAASRPVTIEDADDPRVAAYRDIRERDLVGRQNRFIAEGKVVLDVLLSAGRFAAESILLLPSRLSGMEGVLAKAAADTPVYLASPAVMNAIAGFPLHRGVLAVGRKREEEGIDALLASLSDRALVLAAAGISNHDNMGALFRNAAAFGASAVLLDQTSCDPLYRKAIRVSVGAVLKVPFARCAKAGGLLDALGRNGFASVALSPSGANDLRDVARQPRMALWLGTEGPGLPTDLLSRMQTVRIPIASGWDSLNVAAASAIALYQIAARDGPRA